MEFTKKILSAFISGMMALSMVGNVGALAIENNDISGDLVLCDTNVGEISATAANFTSVLHKLKSSFPHYQQQENSYYCWAECARAIIIYKLGTNYSCANMVAKAQELSLSDPAFSVAPNGAANAETTFGVIGNYLGPFGYMTAITGTPLSRSEVVSYIDSDVPILMCLQNNSHSVNHMVVITGYGTAKYDYPSLGLSTGDFTGLYYMDPMTGTESFHQFLPSDSNFSVTVNNSQTGYTNVTLNWTRAIYSWKYFS